MIKKKTYSVDFETKEKREVSGNEEAIKKTITENKDYLRKAKKSFTENQAINAVIHYYEVTDKKIIDKDDASKSFFELSNCLRYLCKKNRLETLTKFMDLVIIKDLSCTITNMFFCTIDKEQANYFIEHRPSYFQKKIEKAREGHNYESEIRNLLALLSDKNKEKLQLLIETDACNIKD